MTNRFALPLLLTISLSMFAQTPNYTQRNSVSCWNGSQPPHGHSDYYVCNGLPLDQGGVWQFGSNGMFAIDSFAPDGSQFYIAGSPGNPGTGGVDSIIFHVPLPVPHDPKPSTGAEGTYRMTWTATADATAGQQQYTGSAGGKAHLIRVCTRTCVNTMWIDTAKISINQ